MSETKMPKGYKPLTKDEFEMTVSQGGALLPIRKEPVQFKEGDFGPRYKGIPLRAIMIPENRMYPRLLADFRAHVMRIGGTPLSPMSRHVPVRMKWTTAATMAGLTYMRDGLGWM